MAAIRAKADADGDGKVSMGEAKAYAGAQMSDIKYIVKVYSVGISVARNVMFTLFYVGLLPTGAHGNITLQVAQIATDIGKYIRICT